MCGIWGQTDKLVARRLREIRDGVYEAASFLDDDGELGKNEADQNQRGVHGDE